MDSNNQQSLEHEHSFPSRADHLDFEPELEAQIDFRQLVSVARDQELDSQDDQAHIHGGAPDMLTTEETLDLPMKDEGPCVIDPSQLDLPVKKTRNRGPNIIPVEQKELNGSNIRISPHGEVQIRYYPSESPAKVEKLTWKIGPSLIPDGPGDTRTIHFTTEGSATRNAAGETIYLQTRRPSNSKATFPRSTFRTYTIGEKLFALWEQVTRQRQNPDTQSTSK